MNRLPPDLRLKLQCYPIFSLVCASAAAIAGASFITSAAVAATTLVVSDVAKPYFDKSEAFIEKHTPRYVASWINPAITNNLPLALAIGLAYATGLSIVPLTTARLVAAVAAVVISPICRKDKSDKTFNHFTYDALSRTFIGGCLLGGNPVIMAVTSIAAILLNQAIGIQATISVAIDMFREVF